jgi:hypothetical protein
MGYLSPAPHEVFMYVCMYFSPCMYLNLHLYMCMCLDCLAQLPMIWVPGFPHHVQHHVPLLPSHVGLRMLVRFCEGWIPYGGFMPWPHCMCYPKWASEWLCIYWRRWLERLCENHRATMVMTCRTSDNFQQLTATNNFNSWPQQRISTHSLKR